MSGVPDGCLDVRGYACPLTWVKAKVALDRLRPGQVLEVWLRAGEPADSVPRSAEEDGHRLVSKEPLPGEAGVFRVLLEKGLPPPAALP